jgi:DNA-binding ferritin-like protein
MYCGIPGAVCSAIAVHTRITGIWHDLCALHEICDRHNDVATASLIETWTGETERHTWFLSATESGR